MFKTFNLNIKITIKAKHLYHHYDYKFIRFRKAILSVNV